MKPIMRVLQIRTLWGQVAFVTVLVSCHSPCSSHHASGSCHLSKRALGRESLPGSHLTAPTRLLSEKGRYFIKTFPHKHQVTWSNFILSVLGGKKLDFYCPSPTYIQN